MPAAARRRPDLAPPSPADPPRYVRYRIEVFGEPRAPWRTSSADAMADAIALELASWDGTVREHFLAVPVDMKVEIAEGQRPCDR